MKLIAIDLDGTLLNDEHKISEENLRAIQAAQSNGHIVVISTGRSLIDAKQIVKNVGLNCPIIGGNGAIFFDGEKEINCYELTPKTVKEIQAIFEKHEAYYEIFTRKNIFFTTYGIDLLRKEASLVNDTNSERIIDVQLGQYGWTYMKPETADHLDELGAYKFYSYSFIPEKLNRLMQELKLRSDISVDTSGVGKLEIAAPLVNKGNGLEYIAKYFQVPITDTIAIGDNLNDLKMLTIAGIGVAMENGAAEAKEAADFITSTNNEHGVAKAIKKFVLN